MKNILKVEKIFLIYSVIHLVSTWLLTGNNYFANEKLAHYEDLEEQGVLNTNKEGLNYDR